MNQPHLTPGAIFARDFRIQKPLKEGGMGAVYVVTQVSTGRQRALKLMAPALVDNPEVRDRFIREAKVAANIESDHVVETVTAGVDEVTGSPYLVMELLRGEELGDVLLRTGAVSVGDVLEVFSQVGHALEQAHAQGIVHRDLKPENIFLATSKRREVPYTAKILDFGIAKLVADGMNKTGTQPLGSPLFMAPEQTDRNGKICPATDVWALGLIAFYMLTGRFYWAEADGGSLAGLLREVCVNPLAPASQRARELGLADGLLPPGFDSWFSRCVDRNVEARYQDAGEAVRVFSELAKEAPKAPLRLVLNPQLATKEPALDLGSAKTALVDSTDPSHPDALSRPLTKGAAGTTGASISSMPLSPMVTVISPARSRALPIAIAGIAAAALAGGAFWVFGKAAPAPSGPISPTSPALAGAAGQTAASSSSAASPGPQCPPGMVLHPAGSTFMGSLALPEYSGAKIDGRKVKLSAFCLDQTEVTVRSYEACIQEGTCERTPDDVNYSDSLTPEQKKLYVPFCNARKPDRLDHPVNCVNFSMAEQFCKWRKSRLPTEAEWEYAARGMGQHDYPWGDDPPSPTRLNAAGAEFMDLLKSPTNPAPKTMYLERDPFVGTAPVGSFPGGRSSYGVDDLAGNVWEWTRDFYAPYEKGELVDPQGPKEGKERVIRGGAFNSSDPTWTNPAWRYHTLPDRYSHAVGFRCAASLAP